MRLTGASFAFRTAPNRSDPFHAVPNGAKQHWPVMPRINLTVQPELYDYILQHKPKSLSVARFCSLLVEQNALGLDSASSLPAYRVGAGTQQSKGFPAVTASDAELRRSASDASVTPTAVEAVEVVQPDIDQALEPQKNKARAKDAYGVKAINPDLVPADLLDCQQLLPEFWAAKKGTRSEGVWNRVCNKLRQWTPEQRREALERAIASGWGDVFEPPAAKPVQQGFALSATGTPLTVNEQIAAAAIRNIRAMEERRAAA